LSVVAKIALLAMLQLAPSFGKVSAVMVRALVPVAEARRIV
jgi:hypothetical protein